MIDLTISKITHYSNGSNVLQCASKSENDFQNHPIYITFLGVVYKRRSWVASSRQASYVSIAGIAAQGLVISEIKTYATGKSILKCTVPHPKVTEDCFEIYPKHITIFGIVYRKAWRCLDNNTISYEAV